MKIYKSIHLKAFRIVFCLLFLSSLYSYGQEETMEDAILTLSFSEENNTKIILAKAIDQNGFPIEELDLSFFVKRTFSLLPIGDGFNSTDENGEVEVEFPTDLPGNSNGDVIIFVKIIESDLYNDLSIETIKKWGVPTQINETFNERSLWASASNAPITLIIIVCSMILVVWYIILYIIFNFYKISKVKYIKS